MTVQEAHTVNDGEVITATIRIAASPGDIFPYLIDPTLLVQWIGKRADLSPHPGGIFAIDFGETQVEGTYVAVEPPHRAVFTWGVPGDATLPAGSSTVEIVLRAEGDETVVELVHRDLPVERLAQHEAGWASLLPNLQQRLVS